ncbi:hypothetical protein FQN54_000805 [Arachnomyces sp. PD_36]|nr:hypothetical protein FQN54_000805 [Arachnomyces sp. PD_36]
MPKKNAQEPTKPAMGHVLSSPPTSPPRLSHRNSRNMPPQTCEHGHCCHQARPRRRRARTGTRRNKKRKSEAAFEELLLLVGELLKEYVKGVKERREGSEGKKRRKKRRREYGAGDMGGSESRGRSRRNLEDGYEGSAEAIEEAEYPPHGHCEPYKDHDEADEELSPMEQARERRYQRHGEGGIHSSQGLGNRTRTHRSLSQGREEQELGGHAPGFGFVNVDRFRHPTQPTGQTRHHHDPWRGDGSTPDRRGFGEHLST